MSNSDRRIAIVTGGSSGIGLGMVQALLEKGYGVVATSRSATKSAELKQSETLATIDGDAGLKDTAVRVAELALSKFGRIDLLVNNAGMFASKRFTEYTEEDFSTFISTNVASFFFMSQQVIPTMQKQKCGHIVNISTTLVNHAEANVPASLPVITKSTMPAFSREMAIEYAKDGIRVNTISPGVIATPMHKPEALEQMKQLQPTHKLGEIADIVDALFYLEKATFVSGEDLRVDGGAHAGRW